jgi:hypothetical protein
VVFPRGVPHHIQALGDGVEFLLVFDDGMFSENSTFLMSDFFAHTPKTVLAKNFGWSIDQLEQIPEREKYIFPGQLPPPLDTDRVVSPTGDVPARSNISCTPRHRSASRADLSGSQTRPTSPRQPRRPRRSSKSNPVGYASCTGIPAMTSGSITSPGSAG